jgi:hypothetical protein
MLQRIQSIWLLLAAVFAVITFSLPFYSGDRIIDELNNFTAFMDLNAKSNIWLSILTATSAAIALITIFLFENRKLQLRLCYLGIFITVLLLVLYFAETNYFATGNFAITCLLHFGVLVFYILAARGIWKDNKLIKSMDRLR